MNHNIIKNMTCPVVDLHTKVSGAPPPPQQDQILSFLHMFSPISACFRGWRPLQRGLAPPQREILKPPLMSIQYKFIKLRKCNMKITCL